MNIYDAIILFYSIAAFFIYAFFIDYIVFGNK